MRRAHLEEARRIRVGAQSGDAGRALADERVDGRARDRLVPLELARRGEVEVGNEDEDRAEQDRGEDEIGQHERDGEDDAERPENLGREKGQPRRHVLVDSVEVATQSILIAISRIEVTTQTHQDRAALGDVEEAHLSADDRADEPVVKHATRGDAALLQRHHSHAGEENRGKGEDAVLRRDASAARRIRRHAGLVVVRRCPGAKPEAVRSERPL